MSMRKPKQLPSHTIPPLSPEILHLIVSLVVEPSSAIAIPILQTSRIFNEIASKFFYSEVIIRSHIGLMAFNNLWSTDNIVKESMVKNIRRITKLELLMSELVPPPSRPPSINIVLRSTELPNLRNLTLSAQLLNWYFSSPTQVSKFCGDVTPESVSLSGNDLEDDNGVYWGRRFESQATSHLISKATFLKADFTCIVNAFDPLRTTYGLDLDKPRMLETIHLVAIGSWGPVVKESIEDAADRADRGIYPRSLKSVRFISVNRSDARFLEKYTNDEERFLKDVDISWTEAPDDDSGDMGSDEEDDEDAMDEFWYDEDDEDEEEDFDDLDIFNGDSIYSNHYDEDVESSV